MLEVIKRLGYYPRYCVWELTLSCNMRCLHCGSIAGRRRDGELSFEDCLRVADDLAELGCEKVTLGGGEPTLHPRWHEIGKRLADQGVRVNIVTNGWSFDDEQVEKARFAGLQNVAFSVDGLQKAHDAIRKPGSFARIAQAVERTRKAEIPCSTVTHINKLNHKSLPELRDLFAEWGIASWQIQLGNPSGTMSEHQELVIGPEELLWLVPQIAGLREDAVERPHIFAADNVGYFGIYEEKLRDQGAKIGFWLGCRAGCQVIGIESDGTIKGCLSLPSSRHGRDDFVEKKSLRDHRLAEIWRDPEAFAYNRQFKEEQLTGFCGACRYRDICRGGCAWTAYSHTDSRFDNPYCFYRQAVLAGRLDLLGEDEPTEAERRALGQL